MAGPPSAGAPAFSALSSSAPRPRDAAGSPPPPGSSNRYVRSQIAPARFLGGLWEWDAAPRRSWPFLCVHVHRTMRALVCINTISRNAKVIGFVLAVLGLKSWLFSQLSVAVAFAPRPDLRSADLGLDLGPCPRRLPRRDAGGRNTYTHTHKPAGGGGLLGGAGRMAPGFTPGGWVRWRA